jgi:hypothetical protein
LLNRAQEWDPEMFDDVDLPEDGDEPITAPERMLVDLLVENVSLFMLIGGQAEDSLAMILYAIELFPPAIEYLEDILPIVALQYASDGRLDDIVSRLQEFSAENPELG